MCFECAINEGDKRAERHGGTFAKYLRDILAEHPEWNTKPNVAALCKEALRERGAIIRKALGVKTNEEALAIIDEMQKKAGKE
jgi:hypothetical protein